MNEDEKLEKNIYANTLLQKVKDIEAGLKYYIEKSESLENELSLYKDMYEHRVDEFIKNTKKEE